MTSRGLLKNNEPIPNRPYQTNFPTEGGGEYITAFRPSQQILPTVAMIMEMQ